MTDVSAKGAEIELYQRQIMLNEIGLAGQEKISNASVLVVGAGGLGSPVSQYLSAAGIKKIGIVDYDTVDPSNLHRQLLYSQRDIGRQKATVACEKLSEQFPCIVAEPHLIEVTPQNIDSTISSYDFVVDGTDNFAAKFLINDACVKQNKPFSHGGILEFTGQLMTVIPGETCCYRCVFGEVPDEKTAASRSHAGVLGPIPGIVGSLQANETLKYLSGNYGNLLTDKLLTFNSFTMKFRIVPVKRQLNCPACGDI